MKLLKLIPYSDLNAVYCILPLFPAVLILLLYCATTTGCTSTGQLTPTASTDIQNALLTAENVLQQSNNGLQTGAPTVSALLTQTHNQGDATTVNNIAAESAAFTPALTALLATLDAAIKAVPTGSAQVAAVNAALSPATAAAIVAPIAAASN